MRNSILFCSFIFYLFGFALNNSVTAADKASFESGLSGYATNATSSSSVPCYTPAGLYTTNITQTSAELNWSPASGAQSYSVQIRLPNGYWEYLPGSPFMNSWVTAYNLNPGTTYEWRVRSNCGYGYYSYWSQPITFTTLGSSSCNAPDWLETFNITQTTATWDWSPVSGAQSYSVQWRYAGGTWYNLNGGPWTSTILNVGGLQPGTAYEWRVRSNCYYGSTSQWSYAASFSTLGSVCNVPAGTYTSNITQTGATLNWSAVYGADSYSVQIRLPNGTWSYVTGSPFYSTWVNVDWLTPGTTYEWRVRANCGYGNSSNWSYPISFTTLGSFSCYPPDWLYTGNITQTTATLDWSTVSGAQSYSVQWRYPGGTWYYFQGGPWTNSILLIGGLQPGTTYEWRVKSNCANGVMSDWSYVASFTTLGYYCTTPTWPSTYNITQNSATFSWSGVPGADSYSVEIRLPNGTWYPVAGSPVTGTSITATGLDPATTYQWRVRANCGNGQYSNWTYPVSFTTLGSVCHAPTWLYTSNITQTSATLGWSSVSGAASYSVQWRLPGGPWYDVPGSPSTSTWISLNGLDPNTTYQWQVRTNCYNGMTSDWSYIASFTTLGSYCGIPTWPSTYNITQTSATFSWSGVSGAQSYSVEIRLPNGTWSAVNGSPVTGTSITATGLTPGTTYEWRVRSNCSNGQYSSWTYPVWFTTLGSGGSCVAPDWLETFNITQTTATWDWSPVNGAVSYSVQWRYAGGTWYFLSGGPWSNTILNIGGLQPGTAYEWRVRSNCSNGVTSEWSAGSSFTTLGNTCETPTGLFTSNISDNSATFNWTAVAGADSYSVQTRLPGGTWAYIPGSPFSGTSATANWFSPGTTYEWRVRTNCGGGLYSYWTIPMSFTTTGSGGAGGNDDCGEAIVLSVNSECMNVTSTNFGATPSTPAPVGWCPTNWYKDVWFKFTMPDVPNPTVTIRTTAGTLTDAVMEVYKGPDCNNMTYLACEDDNYNGNGSTMPVLSVTGNQAATIWVRVWGYGGTTGSFNICVFDYQSNSLVGNTHTLDVAPPEDLSVVPESTKTIDFDTPSILQISPNPASNLLNVNYTQTEDRYVTAIVMTDMSGKIMIRNDYQSKGVSEFGEQLDVSRLTPGMYILQVVTTKGILSEKVMVVE